MKITFYEYLRTQINRDDPIGDFATDTMDLDVQALANNKDRWEAFLDLMRASTIIKRAFNQAWTEYQQLLKFHPKYDQTRS